MRTLAVLAPPRLPNLGGRICVSVCFSESTHLFGTLVSFDSCMFNVLLPSQKLMTAPPPNPKSIVVADQPAALWTLDT